MDPTTALEIGKEAIFVLLKVSLPLMLVALIVGLVISLFQALTQIQEQTLSFVPKLIAVFVALIIFLPFIGNQLSHFSEDLSAMIIESGN
jgi:flagellar biosynthetic protein FliQ